MFGGECWGSVMVMQGLVQVVQFLPLIDKKHKLLAPVLVRLEKIVPSSQIMPLGYTNQISVCSLLYLQLQ